MQPPYEAGDAITTGTLYRRIPPRHGWFHGGEPTPLAFKPKSNAPGISAYLANLTTPEDVLAGHESFGLAEISVQSVIQAGFSVTYDPKEGPGHVIVTGDFRASKCRELKRKSRVLIPPTMS